MIGRFLMYGALVALAVFVLSATLILDHGGQSIASVEEVSTHDLASVPARYEGAHVTTTGTISYTDEHERYQVTGDANTTVVIREYHGHRDLTAFVGREVRVNGVFGSDDEFGVFIDADSIEPASND